MPSERIQRRIDRLLDQAEEAADRRDWSEVRELAREALSRLEFPLPETGTILLKANATLSAKALSNHRANHLHASE